MVKKLCLKNRLFLWNDDNCGDTELFFISILFLSVLLGLLLFYYKKRKVRDDRGHAPFYQGNGALMKFFNKQHY